MKKILAVCIALGCITTVFAQGDRRDDYRRSDDDGRGHNNTVFNQSSNRPGDRDVFYNNHQQDRRPSPMEDRARREELERMNRDYDRRINDYRNNRSLPPYERDRRIAEIERERKDKNGSFAGGAVVGAVAGVILGVLLSK